MKPLMYLTYTVEGIHRKGQPLTIYQEEPGTGPIDGPHARPVARIVKGANETTFVKASEKTQSLVDDETLSNAVAMAHANEMMDFIMDLEYALSRGILPNIKWTGSSSDLLLRERALRLLAKMDKDGARLSHSSGFQMTQKENWSSKVADNLWEPVRLRYQDLEEGKDFIDLGKRTEPPSPAPLDDFHL